MVSIYFYKKFTSMKHLYAANLNNDVVAFATSLEDFVQIIHELLPISKQYTINDFVEKFEQN